MSFEDDDQRYRERRILLKGPSNWALFKEEVETHFDCHDALPYLQFPIEELKKATTLSEKVALPMTGAMQTPVVKAEEKSPTVQQKLSFGQTSKEEASKDPAKPLHQGGETADLSDFMFDPKRSRKLFLWLMKGLHNVMKDKGLFGRDRIETGDCYTFWQTATEYCVKPTLATVRSLIKDLSNAKKKSTQDVDAFSLKIRQDLTKLTTITKRMTLPEFIQLFGACALIRGMPAEFVPIVTVLDAGEDQALDMEKTTKCLRNFEQNQGFKPSDKKKTVLVAAANAAGDDDDCRNFKNTGKCRFGDKCRYKHTAGKGSKKPNPKPKADKDDRHCSYCDRDGHLKAKCFKAEKDLKALKAKRKADEQKKPEEKAGAAIFEYEYTNVHKVTTIDDSSSKQWSWDLGASMSITNDPSDIANAEDCHVAIGTGNGTVVSTNRGKVGVDTTEGIKGVDVMLLPGSSKLLSFTSFLEDGKAFVIQGDRLFMVDRHLDFDQTAVVATGTQDPDDRLFKLDPTPKTPQEKVSLMRKTTWGSLTSLQLAHNRLGHLHTERLKATIRGLKGDDQVCEPCQLAKSTKQPVSKMPKQRSAKVLQIVYVDKIGKKSVRTPEGFCTGLIALDDKSTRLDLILAKDKSLTLEELQDFRRRAEAESGQRLQSIYGDSEGLFKTDLRVKAWCQENNIHQLFSPPYQHALNRVERYVRTVEEMGCALMATAGVPPSFWGYAELQSVFILNSIPVQDKKTKDWASPEETFMNKKNSKTLKRLHTFGCLAWVHIEKPLRDREQALRWKAKRCVLLDNAKTTPGAWRFINLETRRIIESADVTVFAEARFPYLEANKVNLQGQPSLDNFETEPIDWQPEVEKSDSEEENHVYFDASELSESKEIATPQKQGETPQKQGEITAEGKHDNLCEPSPEQLPALDLPTPTHPREGGYKGRRSKRLQTKLSQLPSAQLPTTAEYDAQVQHDREQSRKERQKNLQEAMKPMSAMKRRIESSAKKALTASFGDHVIGELGQQLWDNIQQHEMSGGLTAMRSTESAFFATAASVEGETEAICSVNDQRARQDVLHAYAHVVNEKHEEAWKPTISTPKSTREAHNSREKKQWMIAEDKEMDSQEKHLTYRIVKRPKRDKVHTTKFVYKVKPGATVGQKHLEKARFTIRGFTFRKGIDFKETYAPVARLTTERIVLVFITKMKLKDCLIDFKVAFLNGLLGVDAKIYIELPTGFENLPGEEIGKRPTISTQERKRRRNEYVGEALKAIYGSPQGSNAFYVKLSGDMLEFGFKRMKSDLALFIYSQDGEIMIVATWVDDLTTGYSSDKILDKFMAFLRNKGYTVKNLGQISKLLGMNVKRDKDGVFSIGLQDYIAQALKMHKMEDCKVYSTPQRVVEDESKDGKELTNQKRFRSMLGSAMFACVAAKPDIAQAVGRLSRKMAAPTKADQLSLNRLYGYLKGVQFDVMRLHDDGKGEITVKGFVDASWADDRDNRRSTSGYLFFVGGALVAFRSVLQKCVALSTVQAEYQAASDAVREAFFIFQLLGEICEELGLSFEKPIHLHEDNQGAIILSKRPASHQKNKHIDLRYHYLREKVKEGVIALVYVSTKEQLADILTKALSRVLFVLLRDQIMGGLKAN
jgi:hypothetical protein